MARVTSITLMFKNCESIELPLKYIGHIFIGDIKTNIERITLNNIEQRDVAKEFFIEIFKEGDLAYDGFYNCNIFERIVRYRDLYMLEIKYDDETTQYITLAYQGTDHNLYQNTWISRLGNLYLVVSARRQVDDYIVEREANNLLEVEVRKSPALKPPRIKHDEYEEGEDEDWRQLSLA